MLPMTREWVTKAESDYDGACEALRSRKKSRRDRICFFSQQCVEKYLKARLTEAGVAFPRTHELSILLRLCLPIEPLWGAFDRALANMIAVVSEARGTPEQIARLIIYVTAKDEYKRRMKEIGERYRARMGKHFPAMVLVEVKSLLEDDAKIEIEGIAVL